MPQGLQCWDALNNLTLDVTDRITRVLVTDTFAYADTFTRTYTFDEFLQHMPFVICSSFNVYNKVVDSVDVYLAGSPLSSIQNVWYQITWSLSGNTLTLSGKKSDFNITGTFGTATIRTDRISKPPFMLIIGVY